MMPVEKPMEHVEWVADPEAQHTHGMSSGSMLSKLEGIEQTLPSFLEDTKKWKGIDINYHPPHVERVFLQHTGLRVCLHFIHPCESGEALFHPHPWPSAMHILSGKYEMALGYAPGKDEPSPIATMIVVGGMSYEMVDPDAWHFVRPLENIAMSLMVTGKPWSRIAPRSEQPLPWLREERKYEIINAFKDFYS